METLAIAVKRAQDKAAVQLSELEEEMEQRIQAAEQKVKKEVSTFCLHNFIVAKLSVGLYTTNGQVSLLHCEADSEAL